MRDLYIIDIQSITDVITNSSSEIFVIDKNNTKEQLMQLLDNSDFSNWRSCYYDPCTVMELSDHAIAELAIGCYDEFKLYLWRFDTDEEVWRMWFQKNEVPFKEEYVYDEEDDYTNILNITKRGAQILRETIHKKYPNRLYLMSSEENPGSYYREIFESILGRDNKYRLEIGWDYKPIKN